MKNFDADLKKLFQDAQKFGELEPQKLNDWSGDIQLPDEIGDFYTYIGPNSCTLDVWFEDFKFPALKDLWELHEGFRWHGLTKERVEEWLDNWIILSESRLDPLIYDTETGNILFARHGGDSWNPIVVFENIHNMLLCLSSMAKIIKEADESAFDEDGCVLTPKYIKKLQHCLIELLGENKGKVIIDAFEIRED